MIGIRSARYIYLMIDNRSARLIYCKIGIRSARLIYRMICIRGVVARMSAHPVVLLDEKATDLQKTEFSRPSVCVLKKELKAVKKEIRIQRVSRIGFTKNSSGL
jgi:hypothetical protein